MRQGVSGSKHEAGRRASRENGKTRKAQGSQTEYPGGAELCRGQSIRIREQVVLVEDTESTFSI